MRKDEVDYANGWATDQGRLSAIKQLREQVQKDQNFFAYSESAWREQLEIIDFYENMIKFIDKSEYINEVYLFIQTLVTVALTCGPKAVSAFCVGANDAAIKNFIDPFLKKPEEGNQ